MTPLWLRRFRSWMARERSGGYDPTALEYMCETAYKSAWAASRRALRRPVPTNRFHAEGARGACFVECDPHWEDDREGLMLLKVGWQCVVVHQNHTPVPVSWVAEVIAIATGHPGGIAGFLAEHRYGGSESYALQVDPPPSP